MSTTERPVRIVTRREVAVLAISLVILAGLSFFSSPSGSLGSVEVKYTDASAHGLAIIPASCPSSPHYPGQCGSYAQGSYGGGYSQSSYYSQASYTGRCAPSSACLNSTTLKMVLLSCAVQTVTCPDGWSCGAGSCVPPPEPAFRSFSATSSTGARFTSSGHLEARPVLVRSGSPTYLYWSVDNVSQCTIADDAGDSWTGTQSSGSGQVTSPLTAQTTFTLDCTPLKGSSATSIHEAVTVNVAPSFQEL